MGKYIYKITNKINGKIYIGQTNNPQKRFTSHCEARRAEKDNSPIGKSIMKYGKENFSFEVLGFYENYNQKEKDFISFYHSLAPNGYNIMEGGENPPIMAGENNPFHKITAERAKQVQMALLNYSIPRKEIVKQLNITYDILRQINEGTTWKDNKLKYPLRPQENVLQKERVEKVKQLLKETNLSHREIAKQVQMKRSFVTMINNGKNHFDENESYPIRENAIKKYIFIRKLLLETQMTFQEIAEQTNVSCEVIQAISSGKIFRDNTLTYPLR